jgi:hypothetical protein
MLATVDISDLGTTGTVRSLLQRPRPADVRGLRWADIAVAAPLATSRPPSARRALMLAFWDDEDSAIEFAKAHPIAQRFADGFHARLQPLRKWGAWPGLPDEIPTARRVDHDGPVVVFTLGQLRPSQLVRFIRTSRPAERRATQADGLIWGTASVRPPFVATVSMWENSDATTAYAFGRELPEHSNAIAEQRRKDFHRRSAFVRFAPLSFEGSLAGPNPLPAAAVGRLAPGT